MYHGILIDQEFIDPKFPEKFKVFANKQDGNWKIYGVEIEDKDIKEAITNIQENLKNNSPWYAHFYNDKELIVVFKNKIFKVISDPTSWKEIIKYGKSLNIPEAQLDFIPNRFQDEEQYFIYPDYRIEWSWVMRRSMMILEHKDNLKYYNNFTV